MQTEIEQDEILNKNLVLSLEDKKKELETRVSAALKAKDFKTAKKLCEQLEEIIGKMR